MLVLSPGLTPAEQPFRIFSGDPRLLIVHGNSTSYHWPHLLKNKLDRQFNPDHQVGAKLALRDGTPIAKRTCSTKTELN